MLDRLVADGGDPAAIVEAEGLGSLGGGDDELTPIVEAALEANADAAEKIRAGNMKAIGAIIGHVMRETKGRADGVGGHADRAREARRLNLGVSGRASGAPGLSSPSGRRRGS